MMKSKAFFPAILTIGLTGCLDKDNKEITPKAEGTTVSDSQISSFSTNPDFVITPDASQTTSNPAEQTPFLATPTPRPVFVGEVLTINDNAVATSQASVQLKIRYDGEVGSVRISADGSCSSGQWETFAESGSIDRTLALLPSQTNAQASFSVQFLSYDQEPSQCYKKSILHDDQAPLITFPEAPSSSIVEGQDIHFVYDISDAGIGVQNAVCKLNQVERACGIGRNTVAIAAMAEGSYSFEIQATDKLGQRRTNSVAWTVTRIVPPVQKYELVLNSGSDYICSPFGTVTVPSEKAGVKCELRYISSYSTLATGVKNDILSLDYFNPNSAHKDDFVSRPEAVYLTSINTPTRRFESGFSTSEGNKLADEKGNALVEYFALKMDTVLKLDSTDAEGLYELATISDDGTVVQIQEGGQWNTVISNDGPHSTRMGCMTRQFAMTKQTRLPVRLYYNQGPRTEIANVLVWHYMGPNTAHLTNPTTVHSYCGKASQNQYWEPTNSAPGTWIAAVYNQGWSVVKPGNYQLPDNQVNPCAYSSYELIQALNVLNSDGTTQDFQLDLVESASAQITLFSVDPDGDKSVVASTQLPANTHPNFQLTLDPHTMYQLEVILDIPAKQIKVRKDYALEFTAVP